jgi:hypothetical protein
MTKNAKNTKTKNQVKIVNLRKLMLKILASLDLRIL